MSSFYGGRRGAGVEIVRDFLTIEEMTSSLLQIDYGKYVSCEEDSGLYRRTLSGLEKVATFKGGAGRLIWTDI